MATTIRSIENVDGDNVGSIIPISCPLLTLVAAGDRAGLLRWNNNLTRGRVYNDAGRQPLLLSKTRSIRQPNEWPSYTSHEWAGVSGTEAQCPHTTLKPNSTACCTCTRQAGGKASTRGTKDTSPARRLVYICLASLGILGSRLILDSPDLWLRDTLSPSASKFLRNRQPGVISAELVWISSWNRPIRTLLPSNSTQIRY